MITFYNISFLMLFFFDLTMLYQVKKLDLYEGDICRKYHDHPDSTCQRAENCKSLAQSIKNKIYPDICMFDKNHPIFCCESTTTKLPLTNTEIIDNKISVLEEVCKKLPQESPVDEQTVQISEFGGINTDPAEYKHMAAIGYNDAIEDVIWGCGGSLISQRWILTAAHCKETNYGLARWVRLGVTNLDDAESSDYRIEQHIIHPEYSPPSLYNDIALFRVDKDVYESMTIFPVCLNSNISFTPEFVMGTGWGQISTGGSNSSHLQKVVLDVFPVEKCNNSYFPTSSKTLIYGIIDESMICAGSINAERDSCIGDSGGPIQTKDHNMDSSLHLLMGITSFEKLCGNGDFPGVYTRVAYYYPWINSIVQD